MSIVDNLYCVYICIIITGCLQIKQTNKKHFIAEIKLPA